MIIADLSELLCDDVQTLSLFEAFVHFDYALAFQSRPFVVEIVDHSVFAGLPLLLIIGGVRGDASHEIIDTYLQVAEFH